MKSDIDKKIEQCLIDYRTQKGYYLSDAVRDIKKIITEPHDCHGKGYEVKGNTIYCRECMIPLFDFYIDLSHK